MQNLQKKYNLKQLDYKCPLDLSKEPKLFLIIFKVIFLGPICKHLKLNLNSVDWEQITAGRHLFERQDFSDARKEYFLKIIFKTNLDENIFKVQILLRWGPFEYLYIDE